MQHVEVETLYDEGKTEGYMSGWCGQHRLSLLKRQTNIQLLLYELLNIQADVSSQCFPWPAPLSDDSPMVSAVWFRKYWCTCCKFKSRTINLSALAMCWSIRKVLIRQIPDRYAQKSILKSEYRYFGYPPTPCKNSCCLSLWPLPPQKKKKKGVATPALDVFAQSIDIGTVSQIPAWILPSIILDRKPVESSITCHHDLGWISAETE